MSSSGEKRLVGVEGKGSQRVGTTPASCYVGITRQSPRRCCHWVVENQRESCDRRVATGELHLRLVLTLNSR